ncbi:MAG: hypothetical protein M0C28_06190 [Candidatus Moduliflexus flocculans]|nr:hypothetical protein [Candidatus Moduliflexus flocculans]
MKRAGLVRDEKHGTYSEYTLVCDCVIAHDRLHRRRHGSRIKRRKERQGHAKAKDGLQDSQVAHSARLR